MLWYENWNSSSVELYNMKFVLILEDLIELVWMCQRLMLLNQKQFFSLTKELVIGCFEFQYISYEDF